MKTLLLCVLWNVFLLIGSTYLITEKGWSKWTMLLAVILLLWPNDKELKKEEG
jgi:hypothetical protein